MIEELRPYPEMKYSGVPWLGEVPARWEVVPLRAVARPRKVTNQNHRELLSVYLGRGVVRFSTVAEKRTNPTSEDLSRYQLVEPGNFVLNNQQAWRGSVGVSRYCGIVSPAYLVLELDSRLDREFADKLLSDRAMVNQYLVCSKGVGSIQRNLYWSHLGQVTTILPPLIEQADIVRFLDYADRRIRRYIRAKQKLIKLLEEQKQAIIQQAVTRGLDPNVRLKPSGVEWLGDVPENWSVRKLRTQFRRHGSGTTPSGDHFYGGGVPWVMTGDLTDGRVETTRRTVTADAVAGISALRLYPPGSLLVAMYGATIGRTGILAIEACTNQACCVLADPTGASSTDYLQAVVNTARSHLVERSYGGGQPNINAEIVRSLPVPVPPRREQEEIAEAIAENHIDAAIASAKREITLLNEYRTRLIADVVTGKLDVREATARLPAEVEEPETLDEVEEGVDAAEASEDELDDVLEGVVA